MTLNRRQKSTAANQDVVPSTFDIRNAIALAGLLLGMCVIIARPLITESYTYVDLVGMIGAAGRGGPSPTLTAWLDFAILCGAALAVVGVRRRAIHWLPVLAFFALMAAVAISTYAANDRRVALNAGFTLIVYAIFAMVCMAQTWRKSVICTLIAALLATGVTFTIKCLLQEYVEFPDLVKQWEADTADRATQPYRPDMINFERRMRAMEPFGYQAHSNVAASFLASWLLLAIGLVGSAFALRQKKVTPPNESDSELHYVLLPAPLALAFASSIWLTGSFGALVSAIFGATTFAVLFWFMRSSSISRRRAFFVTFTPYLALIAFGATIGLISGTLPHPSLAFRWDYWEGAARIFVESPFAGIGRENFGDPYLRTKSITSPEDVKNPHNLWITMLVELGPLGFIAVVALVVAGIWTAFAKGVQSLPKEITERQSELPTPRTILVNTIVAIGVLGLSLFAIDGVFNQSGVWAVWIMDVLAPWLISFGLLCWILPRMLAACAAQQIAAFGCIGGAIALLYHNLVSFSLLVPSGLGLFVAMLIIARSLTMDNAQDAQTRTYSRLSGIAFGLPIVFILIVLVPTMRGDRALAAVRDATSQLNLTNVTKINERLRLLADRVMEADGLSPTLPRRAGDMVYDTARRISLDEGGAAILNVARTLALAAENRSAANRQTQILLANIAYLQQTDPDDEVAQEAFLRESFRHRVNAALLAPYEARGQIAVAEIGAQLWTQHLEDAAREIALTALDRALAVHEARDERDAARLQDDELARVAALRGLLRERVTK